MQGVAVVSATAKVTHASRTSPLGHGSDPMLPPRRNFCLCRGCGAYFLNVAAFERHRVSPQGVESERVCVATPRMRDAGLELDPRGYWRLPKRKFRSTYLRAVS